MSNILAVRIDQDVITWNDYNDLAEYFKTNSVQWFWAKHSPDTDNTNVHWHWGLVTNKTDAAIRQAIKRSIMQTGNKAYSCANVRDLDHYGSYVCFQDSTLEYEVYNFENDVVAKWQQRGHEIVQNRGQLPVPNEPNTKNPRSKIDWVALCFQDLGAYPAGSYAGQEEYQTAEKFMAWVRRHKCLRLYGLYKDVYRAWKDSSVACYFTHDTIGEGDEPYHTKSRNTVRKEIMEYKDRVIQQLLH